MTRLVATASPDESRDTRAGSDTDDWTPARDHPQQSVHDRALAGTDRRRGGGRIPRRNSVFGLVAQHSKGSGNGWYQTDTIGRWQFDIHECAEHAVRR